MEKLMTRFFLSFSMCFFLGIFCSTSSAQNCPSANLKYWQAFPPGGESDLSARHQQTVLKKRCPSIDTIVQYKPGAGGALMWSTMNSLAGDGLTVVGINLPHTVLQPMEGSVQYKTEDITPIFWFHYTPDALIVPEQSPMKSFADFVKTARGNPGKLSLGGSGLNSANHAAHERLNRDFSLKTTYVPFKGTGDLATSVIGAHIDGVMSYTAFAVNNRGKVRALAVAMEKGILYCPTYQPLRNWVLIGWTGRFGVLVCRSPRRSKPGVVLLSCGQVLMQSLK